MRESRRDLRRGEEGKNHIARLDVHQQIEKLLSLRAKIEALTELEKVRRRDLLSRLSDEPTTLDLLGRVLRLFLG